MYTNARACVCSRQERTTRVLSRIDRRRLFRGQVARDRPRFERSPSRIIDTAAKCQARPDRGERDLRKRAVRARIYLNISYHFEYLIATRSKCRITDGGTRERFVKRLERIRRGQFVLAFQHTRQDRHVLPSNVERDAFVMYD